MYGKLVKALRILREEGPHNLISRTHNYYYKKYLVGYSPLRGFVTFVTSRYPIGTHVLDYDWDLLIILDACRYDALEALSGEYDFINDISSVWSIAGQTGEWLAHTFDSRYKNEISNTGCISSNPHVQTVLVDRMANNTNRYDKQIKRLRRYGSWDMVKPVDTGYLEQVWKYYSTEQPAEFTPPRQVTDRAISVARENDLDRYIIHYMQPHSPYIASAIEEERELHPHEFSPFDYIRETGDRETVFQTYLRELRFVLDDVELLLENFDADTVVISADHGEAFGEYGVYAHHVGSLHPSIRTVPWVETTASDERSYEPELEPTDLGNRDVKHQMEFLGYLD